MTTTILANSITALQRFIAAILQQRGVIQGRLIKEFHGLIAGQHYLVSQSFVDANGQEHKTGEKWLLVGSMFSKFDDIVTLCVSLENAGDYELPLDWRGVGQKHVIENFSKYLAQT